MSSIQCWLGSVPAWSLILAGGHAPASWQRELARHTAKLNDLSQSCQWVNDSAHLDLRLQDSPLLGHGLADLTAQPAPTKPAPETVRVPHRRFTWTEPLQRQREKPDFADDRPSKRSPIGFPDKPTPTKPIPQEREFDKNINFRSSHERMRLSAYDRMGVSGSVELTSQEVRKLRSPPSLPLKSQASQALLHRLAGETSSIASLSLSQRSRSQLISLAKQGSLSAPQVSVTRQSWRERLTHRVRQTLNPASFERLNRFDWPSPSSLHQPERSQGLGFGEQWAMPLNGRSAPPELLYRWANLPIETRFSGKTASEDKTVSESLETSFTVVQNQTAIQQSPLSAPEAEIKAAADQTPGQRSSSGPSISETELSQPMSPSAPVSGGLARWARAPLNTGNGFQQRRTSAGSPQQGFTTQGIPLPTPSLADGTPSQLIQSSTYSVQENGVRDVREVSIEPGTSARIAPPVVSVPLPQLRPAQTVTLPAPTIATLTARQGAKQEETATTEDDLDKLAAKIKRILDEEARRYGIDV